MILPVVDMSSEGIAQAPFINGVRCTAYPNPASEIINLMITLNAFSCNNNIEVLDTRGKRILYENTGAMNEGPNNININVSTWPSGSYFCIFDSGSGRYAIRINVAH
jgi:hypothetical protein